MNWSMYVDTLNYFTCNLAFTPNNVSWDNHNGGEQQLSLNNFN
jgi:hypothetical protein